MLYSLNNQIMKALNPLHQAAIISRQWYQQPWNPLSYSLYFRTVSACLELIERLTCDYEEPEWGLNEICIANQTVAVDYQVVAHKPYCNLLHFKRQAEGLSGQPKVLMLAPLSGHYATLLRGTVKEFLPDHEVYITDWINAREVPLSAGEFSFDDYVEYIMDFIQQLGPDVHVLAVCQPCVPALVAAAVMAKNKDKKQAKSLTLMGGPVDVRISPTEVNDYASGKDLEWFESNVICKVPPGFPGTGHWVYPGFIQLSGFMSMNMDSHINKHFKFFTDLIKGDGDSAEAHRQFYNEYLAVMDMPAQYYLDTIRNVFLEHRLPKGEMEYRGQKVDLGVIKKTALLTIEGEMDDITGRGQTKAAIDLCSGIAKSRKEHYEQKDVGHYGIFNGRRFREFIAPKVKAFMASHSK